MSGHDALERALTAAEEAGGRSYARIAMLEAKIAEMNERIAELEAECDALRAGLKPFADRAAIHLEIEGRPDNSSTDNGIPIAHFRRARALLTKEAAPNG